jgi:hypothetical protein
MAQQREEACNCERLIAISQNLEIYGVPVVKVRKEGYGRVYWNHEDNTYDTVVIHCQRGFE